MSVTINNTCLKKRDDLWQKLETLPNSTTPVQTGVKFILLISFHSTNSG